MGLSTVEELQRLGKGEMRRSVPKVIWRLVDFIYRFGSGVVRNIIYLYFTKFVFKRMVCLHDLVTQQ